MEMEIQKGDPSGVQQGEDLQCLAFQEGILKTSSFFIWRFLLYFFAAQCVITLHWLQEALDQAQNELKTNIFELPKEKFPLSTFLRPRKHFSTVVAFRAGLRYTASSTFATAEEEALHMSVGFSGWWRRNLFNRKCLTAQTSFLNTFQA